MKSHAWANCSIDGCLQICSHEQVPNGICHFQHVGSSTPVVHTATCSSGHFPFVCVDALQDTATCGPMCACSTPAGEAHHSLTQPVDSQQTMAMTLLVSSPGVQRTRAPNVPAIWSHVFWSTSCTWCSTSSGGAEGVPVSFQVLTLNKGLLLL